MDRHWLITWTCYGAWLSGDGRSFVSNVRDDHGDHVRHNLPGTPCDADMPLLEAWMRDQMTGDPVTLDKRDADAMIQQYLETARIRGWTLQAASVMYNHTHVLVGVPGDPSPDTIRETLKSWATRRLRQHRSLPPNGTFWTAKGSRRKMPDEVALRACVAYVVKKQPDPLAVYYALEWQELLEAWEMASRAP
jgi:REP element-mobilizing transposase RayT